MILRLSEACEYLEINVAAFRKLIKRHDKNVPKQFQSNNPFEDYSKLLNTKITNLIDTAETIRSVQDEFYHDHV